MSAEGKEPAAFNREWEEAVAKTRVRELSLQIDLEQAEIIARFRIAQLRTESYEKREKLKAEGKPVSNPNDPWVIECQETLEFLIRAQCIKEQYWKAKLESLRYNCL